MCVVVGGGCYRFVPRPVGFDCIGRPLIIIKDDHVHIIQNSVKSRKLPRGCHLILLLFIHIYICIYTYIDEMRK